MTTSRVAWSAPGYPIQYPSPGVGWTLGSPLAPLLPLPRSRYKKFLDQLTPVGWFRETLSNIEVQRNADALERELNAREAVEEVSPAPPPKLPCGCPLYPPHPLWPLQTHGWVGPSWWFGGTF